ncbi:MAG: hypothetical protein BGO25_01650 [Acidobacteriales bacterium 59-55]|nr:hypothetical protein [Terriglobales bacterium]OJV39534.1 MAG: hypothetical protein BGO25_01650 [Acidobacteriales bacterium 59-55]
MQYELRLHRLLLAILATVVTGVALLFFYLSSHPVDVWLEASISLIVVIAVATALVYMGVAEGIVALQFGMRHKRELLGYLLLGLLSVSSGLYLAISKVESLQIIALVVSPHAFLFGIAELRISRHLQHHPKQRRALLFFGACEVALGLALVIGSKMSTYQVATLLGYGAVITSLQLLAFLIYQYRRAEREISGRIFDRT